MGKLDTKVAVISGAAQGLGVAMARLFAAEGAHIVLLDVFEKEGRALAEEVGADGGELAGISFLAADPQP